MPDHVLDLREIDRAGVALAGGKGAHLGELTRIDGVRVPPGFCLTTAAFELVTAGMSGAEIRRAVEAVDIPAGLAAAVTGRLDDRTTYAVRSSATAEDTPTASFAGQYDTYLDVAGRDVLDHVRRCWASLFTDRAVAYRRRAGVDHRQVRMAVVVQQMVRPRASGVLFTADPVTGNRRVCSIDAVAGLGEALVSGQVNADVYRVRDGVVTVDRQAGPERPVLSEPEIHRLVDLGRRIEAHFGHPQDIEWCLDGDGFAIVQSRPITTLFPVPAGGDDGVRHVYLSVGHQQMMTEAMKPLGLAVWKLTSPADMRDAGGRLFVDVSSRMAAPASGAALLEMIGRSDPLTGDALRSLFPDVPDAAPAAEPATPVVPDPAVVAELIEQNEAALAVLKRDIRTRSGVELLDFIKADLKDLQRTLFVPRSLQAIMAGMDSARWLNEHLAQWLGERDAADTLTRSVPGNVTSEMGLALLDVADAIRPYPDVVAVLEQAGDDFLDALPGPAADAVRAFLDRYGMRCVGEIDITRPRWSERPAAILPMILGNVRNFEPGERERHFERGRLAAEAKEHDVLSRLRQTPDGERKAAETKQQIDLVRNFSGYREYPKYHMICRYLVYKQALLAEAGRILDDPEDIFYLTYAELYDLVRTGGVDRELLRARAEEFAWFRTLRTPRVLTSDGEVVTGSYRRAGLPGGALAGLPVSAGTVEGRARVVADVADAHLAAGDILVTAYTDPSWTPVFVSVAGLVTEVGGLMTHGAVIAREYGLPAVVGVEGATTSIRDGQRIRVHGTDGYVELLPD